MKTKLSAIHAPDQPSGGATKPMKKGDTQADTSSVHLQTPFDPKGFPHYDVVRAIYSLLLSAMSLSEHYGRLPGYEDRQKKLEALAKEYLDLCENIQSTE